MIHGEETKNEIENVREIRDEKLEICLWIESEETLSEIWYSWKIR